MDSTNEYLDENLRKAKSVLAHADCVIVGAGAGLSAAAGLLYLDFNTFDTWFKGYAKRYGLAYIYEAAFYHFPTPEEYFAYWARHIGTIRYNHPPGEVYRTLYNFLKDRQHFIITTNVDGQFEKAGFDPDKLFTPQGDYAFFQCSKPCTNELFHNKEIITALLSDLETSPFAVKSEHIPRCPYCKSLLEPNIRKAYNFVEEPCVKMKRSYMEFLEVCSRKKTALLELGVGYNTPTTIRFPFEQFVIQNRNASLIRVNMNDGQTTLPLADNYTLSLNGEGMVS